MVALSLAGIALVAQVAILWRRGTQAHIGWWRRLPLIVPVLWAVVCGLIALEAWGYYRDVTMPFSCPPEMLCSLILLQLRSLSFLDPLRPPVETGRRADEVGTGLEGDTAGGLGILQIIDRGEMAIGQCGVGEWPEMFGRLEFRRIRRQEQQVNMLGNAQLEAGVPPRSVQHQHDLLRWAGADLARKLG